MKTNTSMLPPSKYLFVMTQNFKNQAEVFHIFSSRVSKKLDYPFNEKLTVTSFVKIFLCQYSIIFVNLIRRLPILPKFNAIVGKVAIIINSLLLF
jgi:hypothetical protein